MPAPACSLPQRSLGSLPNVCIATRGPNATAVYAHQPTIFYSRAARKKIKKVKISTSPRSYRHTHTLMGTASSAAFGVGTRTLTSAAHRAPGGRPPKEGGAYGVASERVTRCSNYAGWPFSIARSTPRRARIRTATKETARLSPCLSGLRSRVLGARATRALHAMPSVAHANSRLQVVTAAAWLALAWVVFVPSSSYRSHAGEVSRCQRRPRGRRTVKDLLARRDPGP